MDIATLYFSIKTIHNLISCAVNVCVFFLFLFRPCLWWRCALFTVCVWGRFKQRHHGFETKRKEKKRCIYTNVHIERGCWQALKSTDNWVVKSRTEKKKNELCPCAERERDGDEQK